MLTTEKKKYTVQDYMMLEEGAPFQLIHHDLIMSPSPTIQHQNVIVKLLQAFLIYMNQTNNNGLLLCAPMDVKLDDGNVYQPDLLFVSEERKPALVKERIEGAPDLVIEILSPSNAYYDLKSKKDIYEKYGVKEYIIVDPIQENAEIHFIENGVYVLKQKANKTQLLNSVLLPGLVFDLAKIFA
ncbi:Uma2 family endonuclease [uncultured Mucilaginibacter sp.]|uniref:Uma2 family endonuclease n=1 Tax=uncultured Mucilaginibacter sp. TaxID=797541 RepID=UPI0025DC9063|nr:Uma2 family endonuclease [uncultured Mucilaginibacter sp.]